MQLFKMENHSNEVEYTEDNTDEKEQKEREEIGEQCSQSHEEITSKQHKTPIVEEKYKKRQRFFLFFIKWMCVKINTMFNLEGKIKED